MDAGGKARLEFTLACEGLHENAKPVVGLFGDDGTLIGRTEVSGSSKFEKKFIVNGDPKANPVLKFSVYDSAAEITVDTFLGSTTANFKDLLNNPENKMVLIGNDKQPTGAHLISYKKLKPKQEKQPKKAKETKKGKEKEEEKVDPAKAKKAALKEGGKKAQDICGFSDMGGVKFFHVYLESPQGDWDLMQVCMDGFNKEIDPEADDRKGGAKDLSKLLFSYNNDKLIFYCHHPKCSHDKFHIDEWVAQVTAATGAVKIISATDEYVKGEVLTDADADRFPIKMKDAAINSCYAWLCKQQLVLAEDSDSDGFAYGDDDFPDYYGDEEAASPAASAPAASAAIFADIDQGKEAGADEYKTFDTDFILGKPAPSLFNLEFLDTPNAKPEAGKVTVLFMWGQYHKPGYKYFPLYSQLAKKYGDKVSIVGVSIDPDQSYPQKFLDDPAGKYSKVFTAEGIAMAWDNGTLKKEMMEKGNKKSFSPPQTFVINSKGVIVWYQDHSELGATAPCYMGLMEEQIDACVTGAELKKVGDRPIVEYDDEEGEEMNIEMDDDDDVLGFL